MPGLLTESKRSRYVVDVEGFCSVVDGVAGQLAGVMMLHALTIEALASRY